MHARQITYAMSLFSIRCMWFSVALLTAEVLWLCAILGCLLTILYRTARAKEHQEYSQQDNATAQIDVDGPYDPDP